MAHRHPYSFNVPDELDATLPRRRPFQLSDEGRRIVADREAPATSHDWSVEAKESRTPLYVAGAASVVILGGLLALGGALAGEPPLAPTAVIEYIPRQAALIEKMDAEALDRARIATHRMTSTPAPEPAAPVPTALDANAPLEVEAQSVETPSVEPLQSQLERADEPNMTPMPTLSTPSSRIELDEANPYVTESAQPADAPNASEPATQRGTGTSDNPY
jgi:hypothetical protein